MSCKRDLIFSVEGACLAIEEPIPVRNIVIRGDLFQFPVWCECSKCEGEQTAEAERLWEERDWQRKLRRATL